MKKVLSSIFSLTLVLSLTLFSFNPAQAQNNVTVTVDMSNYLGSFTTVYIAGGFNSWTDANPLTDMGNGVWSAVLSLADGTYECKFMVDNWAAQENFNGTEPCTTGPGANINRVFTVAGAPVSVGTFCWNECDVCGDPPTTVTITWNVNMENETVDPGGVFVAGGGNFGSPGGGGSILLTDPDGDDIYSGTSVQAVGFSSFYTFANGPCGDFSCKENIAGQDCADPANFNDRFLPAVQNDTMINTCFSQCTTDGSCGAPLLPADVTFQVDMSEYAGSFTGMYVFGSFNSWTSGANPLTDMGNGLWAATITLNQASYEYKFITDGDVCPDCVEETFTPGSSCTVGDVNVNRALTVSSADPITTPAYCFDSCNECGVVGTVNILENNELFTLQPTLVNQFTALEFNMNSAAKDISVYNAMGQVFLSENVEQSVSTYKIYTNQFANGVYFVKVQMENNIQVERIMVSH